MNTTKTFTAWNGDKELTREQYIAEWLEATIQFGTLFGEKEGIYKYFALRDLVAEQAGAKWDKQ